MTTDKSSADALTEAERLLLARVNDCTKPIDAADRNGILKLIDRLAACPVEQPASAPIDTPTDREFALSAAICVHPKGVYGDEGGSMCCPITHTRDASFAPSPAGERAARLDDADIDTIAESMPGGLDSFIKQWGWRQFARAVEDEVILNVARAVASSEASRAPIAGERELFEKWAVDTYGPKGATRDERFPNSYLYSSPDDAWAGWQAAWRARAASANETGAQESLISESVIQNSASKFSQAAPSGERVEKISDYLNAPGMWAQVYCCAVFVHRWPSDMARSAADEAVKEFGDSACKTVADLTHTLDEVLRAD